jgi:RHS repeat-associated protein
VKLTQGGQPVQTQQYDARHYRVVRQNYLAGVLAATRHEYYSDDWRLLEERVDAATAPERHFVWGGRYVDDLVLRDRSTSGTLNERLYALQDANWNVTAVTDAAGTVQERYESDPYGVTTPLSPTFEGRSTSAYDWETTYAGYRRDAATGLFAVRNRYYHPMLGTWVTRDRLSSSNLFEYAKSSPITSIDPLGLDPMDVKKAINDTWSMKKIQAGKEAISKDKWNIINPCSPGNFVQMTAMGFTSLFDAVPAGIKSGFQEARLQMDEAASEANNPFTGPAMQYVGKPLAYLGEANASWANLYSAGATGYAGGAAVGGALPQTGLVGELTYQVGATVTNPGVQTIAGGVGVWGSGSSAYSQYQAGNLTPSDLVPIGMSGHFGLQQFTAQSHVVSHWGPPGTSALRGGKDWVQLGKPSWIGQGLSGTPGTCPYKQHISTEVPSSDMKFPGGKECLKGIFGQRKYMGPDIQAKGQP